MKHSEFAFIPMCTPAKGKPWFATRATRHTAKEAREAFADMCFPDESESWKALKLEGWRIVKVRISADQ